MELENGAQHQVLLSQGSIGILGMKGILVEEVLADRPGRLQGQPLLERQRFDADEPGDFLEFGLLLKEPHRFLAQLPEILGHPGIQVSLDGFAVERIALEPVDRREMPHVGQPVVQRPEHLDDLKSGLDDGIGKVAAGRRNGADNA